MENGNIHALGIHALGICLGKISGDIGMELLLFLNFFGHEEQGKHRNSRNEL